MRQSVVIVTTEQELDSEFASGTADVIFATLESNETPLVFRLTPSGSYSREDSILGGDANLSIATLLQSGVEPEDNSTLYMRTSVARFDGSPSTYIGQWTMLRTGHATVLPEPPTPQQSSRVRGRSLQV